MFGCTCFPHCFHNFLVFLQDFCGSNKHMWHQLLLSFLFHLALISLGWVLMAWSLQIRANIFSATFSRWFGRKIIIASKSSSLNAEQLHSIKYECFMAHIVYIFQVILKCWKADGSLDSRKSRRWFSVLFLTISLFPLSIMKQQMLCYPRYWKIIQVVMWLYAYVLCIAPIIYYIHSIFRISFHYKTEPFRVPLLIP